MTRQNRVDPSGRLIADPSKAGTLFGNRGCLHDENGVVVKERTSLKRWIACTLEPIHGANPLMQPGCYTELFFLDEATALAAGHRPCAQCRPEAYKLFTKAWLKAGLSDAAGADGIDKVLDVERRSGEKPLVSVASLPGGAMVRHPGDGSFHLVYGGQLFPWSFSGYGTPKPQTAAVDKYELMTSASTVKVLEAGYPVEVHSSVKGSH
mgnify:CR=1 FL=1